LRILVKKLICVDFTYELDLNLKKKTF